MRGSYNYFLPQLTLRLCPHPPLRGTFPQGKAFAHIFLFLRKTRRERKGQKVKQEEKKPIPWEVADPKPPVIQSGKMENRKQN